MVENISGSFVSGYEQFWRKPAEATDEAIRSSLIVLDTNAVLNLYRMKPSAREEYLRVLEKIRPRIWIPRQVADEFHRNRISSVSTHLNSLKSKADTVASRADELRSALRDFYKLHSLADGRSSENLKPLNDMLARITDTVTGEAAEFDLTPEGVLSHDEILDSLAALFAGKVGDAYPEDVRKEVIAEALRRGKDKIPPGYIDVQQKAENGVGDYFIWRQILDKAKSDCNDILFISTDTKEDWVRVQCGFTIGPRPELVHEMRDVCGVAYHQLPLAAFLARASHVLNVRVSQDTIDQVNARIYIDEWPGGHYRKRALTSRELKERLASSRETLEEAEITKAASERHALTARELLTQAQIENEGNNESLPVRDAQINLDMMKFQYHRAMSAVRKAQDEYDNAKSAYEAYQAHAEALRIRDR